MPIDGTLFFCLGYFQAKYLLHNYLEQKIITSYSLLQVPNPANYSNFSTSLSDTSFSSHVEILFQN